MIRYVSSFLMYIQMSCTLIGNSIAWFIQPGNFRETICMPGAPMKVLLRVAAATPGVAIILCGIPDICQIYHSQNQEICEKLRNFDRSSTSSVTGIVRLCSFPSTRRFTCPFSLRQSARHINDRIKEVNRHRGEVTPDVIRKVFRPPGN